MTGDSIAWATGWRMDNVFSIAQGGARFTRTDAVPDGGPMLESIGTRIDAVLEATGRHPDTILILGGANDVLQGWGNPIAAAVSVHDRLEADGIDVRFVTEPFELAAPWLGYFNDDLRDRFADTIDCESDGYPLSDRIHPTLGAYEAYADCVQGAL
ncbi:MAG: hypothetical protein GY812_03605 [Actinomycetia bacterium]|nr:hypothetical protein [Actinomycetes bacterium]